MFPNDFVNHLKNIWNRGSKRVEQEEKPGIIFVDDTTFAPSKCTFLCYPDNDNVLVTDSKWKIKLIEDLSGFITIKYYMDRNYDKVVTNGAALTALRTANTGFTFLKDI